jgi:hypothetical protein
MSPSRFLKRIDHSIAVADRHTRITGRAEDCVTSDAILERVERICNAMNVIDGPSLLFSVRKARVDLVQRQPQGTSTGMLLQRGQSSPFFEGGRVGE